MLSVAIDRARTRYRLPASVRREQPRLQRIVDQALTRVLEGAVERRGIGSDAYVCIRDVHAVVTLRLREPDSALAHGVGDAIAAAIVQLIDEAQPSVVLYGSRTQALVDLAIAAGAGDFSRSWAWAQLGIWHADFALPADVTAERIVRTLAHEPTHAVAVLAHLARAHGDRFTNLVTRASARAWSALAQAAIVAAGAPADVARAIVSTERGLLRHDAVTGAVTRASTRTEARTLTGGATDAASSTTAHREHRRRSAETFARRAIRQSAIARLAIARFADLRHDVRLSLATLALLEVEPSVAHRDDIATMIVLTSDAIVAAAGDISYLLPQEHGIGGAGAVEPPHSGVVRPSDVHSADASTRVADESVLQGNTTRRETSTAVPKVRQITRTEYGGLLYLLNLLPRIGLLDTIRGDERWSDRGLRWVLHQLAMTIASIEPDDAAALVFAGVAPGAPAPSTEQDPPTDAERAALATLCDAITRALRETLGGDVAARFDSDRRLIDDVCRRAARVFAEPGWVDAHFSIEDVALDIRRVGLDRDPGWLPWIGTVIRFVYA